MPSKPSNKTNDILPGQKITCAHCGAVNQDVRPQDACWQCGKTLSSKPDIDAESSGQTAESGGTKLRNRPARMSLEERVAKRKSERKPAFPKLLTIAAVIAVLIALAVAYFMMHR